MLRISEIHSPNRSVTLRIEGRVIGPWVMELRQTCDRLLSEGSVVRLDLNEVSFVDPEGIKSLLDLISKGVTLTDCSLFVEEQLRSARSG